jgi:ABC-2 type transport system ATP-binding protein
MLCDRIAFLRKGEIVALDTPQNLKNQLGLGEKVTVLYEGSVGLAELERLPGVINVFSAPGRVEMMIDRSAENLDMIVKHFAKARILDIIIMQPDLEDVFLELAR